MPNWNHYRLNRIKGSGGGGTTNIYQYIPTEYLEANEPAASGYDAGAIIMIKDPGDPGVYKVCMEKSNGTKYWHKLALADPP